MENNYTVPEWVTSYSAGTTTGKITDTAFKLCGTIKINDNKEDDKFMIKNLFNINVVTTYGEIIIEDEKAIANTEEEAKFNAGVYENLRDNGLTFDDVTIKINNLGSIKLEKPETEME